VIGATWIAALDTAARPAASGTRRVWPG
jgi:hypothetical protein